MRTLVAVFIVLLGAQGAFWYQTHKILPKMTIVPDVPGTETVKALSLGDEETFFRFLGLNIQNAGDTFGRFTALYQYDFNKLYHWFRLLDTLDDTSNYIPSMATYYFSQTQNRADVKYMVDYLAEHSVDRPSEKWWWIVQAVYLANHKLHDQDLALELAKHLEGVRDIPLWAQQMPAFAHEKRGEMDEAMLIIQGILNEQKDIKQGELNFMRYFVDERIGRLKEMEETLERAQQRNDENQTDEKE